MTPPDYGVAVNVQRCSDMTMPRWRNDDQTAIELPYMEALRVPKHVGMTLMKRLRQVRYIDAPTFKKMTGKRPKIFVVRSMGIGDILMLSPCLRALHEEGWEVHLAVLKAFTQLVEKNPYVAQVYGIGPNEMPPTPIKAKLNLNMRVERLRGAQWLTPRAQLFEQIVGVNVHAVARHPVLVLDDAWRDAARDLVPEDAIAVCVATSSEHRNYEHVEELVRELAGRGRTVVLLHHEQRLSVPLPNVIDLQRKVSCGVMCAVIERCAALVSPDSGPMHVAMTLRTPVVAIEGPTPPNIYHWGYKDSPVHVCQKPLKCIGCWHRGKFAQCAEHGYKDHECMDWPPAEVADHAERIARKEGDVTEKQKQQLAREHAAQVMKETKSGLIVPKTAPVPKPIEPTTAEQSKNAAMTTPRAPSVGKARKLWMTMLFDDEPKPMMERFIERVVSHPAIDRVIAINGAAERNGLCLTLAKTKKVEIIDHPYPRGAFYASNTMRNISFEAIPDKTPVVMMDPDEWFSQSLHDWLPEWPYCGIRFAELSRAAWKTEAEAEAVAYKTPGTHKPEKWPDWQPRLFMWDRRWKWERGAHMIVLNAPDPVKLPQDRFIVHVREETPHRGKHDAQWDKQFDAWESRHVRKDYVPDFDAQLADLEKTHKRRKAHATV